MSAAGQWVEAVLESARQPSSRQSELRRAVQGVKQIGESLLATTASEDELRFVARSLEQIGARLTELDRSSPTAAEPPLGSSERIALVADRNPHVGLHNYLAPPVRFRMDDGEAGVLRASVRYGACHEGPPGCAHGGQLAAFFDELLLSCNTMTGQGGVTVRLTVTYRRPVPLHTDVEGRAWVEREEGRKRFVRGEIVDGTGEVLAEGEALVLPIRSA